MKTSNELDKVLPAIAKVKAELEAVSKSASNPFFKSKYADLNTHLDEVEPRLAKEGLLLLQPVNTDIVTGNSTVESRIYHTESAQFISSEMSLVLGKSTMQDAGSAVTYARRYTLGALLSMKAEDDDANKISGRDVKAATKPVPSWAKETPTVSTKVASPAMIDGTGSIKQGLLSVPNSKVVEVNVNAEFDAIKKPEQTVQPLTNGGQVASTIEPLKKSSFRKKTVAPVVVPPINDTTGATDWS